MSPEQARGAAIDKRADSWAFGVILFELLSGRSCFPGDTVTDVLAAVVKSEPDWAALPVDTPEPVRQLLRRCLMKDRKQRLRDIADAPFHLAEGLIAERTISVPDPYACRSGLRKKAPWALAALGFALAIGVLILWSPWKPPMQIRPDQTSLRLNIDFPAEAPLVPTGFMPVAAGRPTLAFSPDGRYLA